MGLRDFSIVVGPYYGTFTTCGSASNSLGGNGKRTYNCNSQTKGSSLKITNKPEQHLALCRVVVDGEGTIFLQI